MLKNFRDKIALSGITVLMIGTILLIFTFISAYGFLTAGLTIIASQDLVQTFGEALAPLITTCIRIMYLGVMGWIGSLITIRGVTIIAHTPPTPNGHPLPQPIAEQKPQPQPQSQPQPQPQKPKTEKPKEEKPKEEVKSPEPIFVVIPPEKVTQTPPSTPQFQEKKTQQDNSPSQSSSK